MSGQQGGAATHWQRTRNLTFVTLGIWFFFAFFIHWFGAELNNYSFPRLSARFLHGGTRLTHRLCRSVVSINAPSGKN